MHTSFITRAIAASAAVGIALILPATAASAQTIPPVTPVIPPITVTVPGAPIIQIGTPAPTPPASATVTAGTDSTVTGAPASGIRALVPATGDATATAANPAPGLLAPAAPALPASAAPLLGGVPGLATLGQPTLADADVQVDACIAAALLTGQPVTSCSSTITGQPSLVDALSTVGLCVRAKVLTGAPMAPCTTGAGSTDPAGTSSSTGAAPTLANLSAEPSLCLVASILGGTATPCPTAPLTTGGLDGVNPPSTVSTALDACIGAAVLTGTDLTPCTTSTALTDTPPDHANNPSSTDPTSTINGINGILGGPATGAAARPAQGAALDLSTVATGDGNLATPAGTLPFTGIDVGDLVLLALALIGSGVALRRLRAEHHVVNDTRFPRRRQHTA